MWSGSGVRFDRGKRLPGFYARWYDYDQDGKRISRSQQFQTQSSAREYVKQFNARADLKILGKVIPINMADAVPEFMAGCASLAGNTKIHYRISLGIFGRTVGNRNVCEYGGSDVDRFVRERMKGKATGPTIAKDLRAVGRFFNWAVSRGYAEANPLAMATSLPDNRTSRDRPIVSEVQLGKLIDAMDTEDRRIAVWLGMTTGLDRGVIEKLSAERIDWDMRAIIKIRPKTKRRLAIPIHPDLVSLLEKKAEGKSPSQPLLTGLTRQEKHEDWWHRATASVGLTGLLFRDLRAVATSRAQRLAHVTMRDAQEMLGHANIQTTASHYYVPDPDVRRQLDQVPLPKGPKRPEQKTG